MSQDFFCSHCSNKVPADSYECPFCGLQFDAVQCPACGFAGELYEFEHGCPSCGYLDNTIPIHPRKKGELLQFKKVAQSKSTEKTKNRVTQPKTSNSRQKTVDWLFMFILLLIISMVLYIIIA